MNKIIIFLLTFYSLVIQGAEHNIYQLGKTFTPQLSEKGLEELKNSRGNYVSRKVKKVKLKLIKIKSGDTISFHNKDTVVHNVFGNGFNFHQGKESINKKTFKKKGTRVIRCAIHPKMKLKVVVE